MLGIKVDTLSGDTNAHQSTGWNEAERAELKGIIAARQPFLDYVFHRTRADGSQQAFRAVSYTHLDVYKRQIEPQAQKRGLGMAFPTFGTPYFVNADRTRLKQILINLSLIHI